MRKRDKKMASPERTRRAQSTLEYAVLIVIIAAALLATQVYVKRGIQGRFRASTDEIGEQFSTSGNVTIATNSYSQTNEASQNGITTSNLLAESTTNRYESVNLGAAGTEWWGNNAENQEQQP